MVSVETVAGFALFGAILLVGGGALMKRAFDRRRQRHLMEETATSQIESLSVGPAEVVGTARPADRALPAPFTDAECLVAVWKIEEYRVYTDSKGKTRTEWTTIGSGVECVPFYVDDGTGELLVRPDDDVVFDVDERETVEVSAGRRPPDAVEAFLADGDRTTLMEAFGDLRGMATVASGGWTWGRRRRYHQRLIEPGEEVYVFGTVQPREEGRSPDNPENLEIRRVSREDRDLEPLFLVSNLTEAELIGARRWALLAFPVGALVATAGVGLLAYALALLLGVVA